MQILDDRDKSSNNKLKCCRRDNISKIRLLLFISKLNTAENEFDIHFWVGHTLTRHKGLQKFKSTKLYNNVDASLSSKISMRKK